MHTDSHNYKYNLQSVPGTADTRTAALRLPCLQSVWQKHVRQPYGGRTVAVRGSGSHIFKVSGVRMSLFTCKTRATPDSYEWKSAVSMDQDLKSILVLMSQGQKTPFPNFGWFVLLCGSGVSKVNVRSPIQNLRSQGQKCPCPNFCSGGLRNDSDDTKVKTWGHKVKTDDRMVLWKFPVLLYRVFPCLSKLFSHYNMIV